MATYITVEQKAAQQLLEANSRQTAANRAGLAKQEQGRRELLAQPQPVAQVFGGRRPALVGEQLAATRRAGGFDVLVILFRMTGQADPTPMLATAPSDAPWYPGTGLDPVISSNLTQLAILTDGGNIIVNPTPQDLLDVSNWILDMGRGFQFSTTDGNNYQAFLIDCVALKASGIAGAVAINFYCAPTLQVSGLSEARSFDVDMYGLKRGSNSSGYQASAAVQYVDSGGSWPTGGDFVVPSGAYVSFLESALLPPYSAKTANLAEASGSVDFNVSGNFIVGGAGVSISYAGITNGDWATKTRTQLANMLVATLTINVQSSKIQSLVTYG